MCETRVDIKTQRDIIAARQAGRDGARRLGFGVADQTRLATAISELARNVLQHAGEGVCLIRIESNERFIRIQVIIEDHGPGIPDIDEAMERGFSTSQGLGAGLPGAKRLVHEFNIESKPGHTKITIAMVGKRL